jgi:hypothetical protein
VKHFSILLIVCIIVSTLPISSYAETNTPYPPPSTSSENGLGPVAKTSGPTAGEIMADVTFVRPISIAAHIIGIGVAILATPIAAATGTTEHVYKKLVGEPFDFFATRPLGEY